MEETVRIDPNPLLFFEINKKKIIVNEVYHNCIHNKKIFQGKCHVNISQKRFFGYFSHILIVRHHMDMSKKHI